MKKYIVRITDEERKLCDETVDKLVGSSQKARRARILRQVDAVGSLFIPAVVGGFVSHCSDVRMCGKQC